jgi:hypothetical protein
MLIIYLRLLVLVTVFFSILLLGKGPAMANNSEELRSQFDQSVSIEVDLIESPDGVKVVYTASSPISSLTLGRSGHFNEKANILILTEIGELVDGVIMLVKPRTSFSIFVKPDTIEENSVYPVLSNVDGRGYVVFTPSILPTGEVTEFRLTNADNNVRVLDDDVEGKGYIFLGTGQEAFGRFSLVVAHNVSPALRKEVVKRVGSILDYFEIKMDRAPQQTPLIILTSEDAPEPINRGDITRNGVIFLRYRYPADKPLQMTFSQTSSEFLAHEIFHLWQDRESESTEDWWLQEGVAEYASALAIKHLWPDLSRFDERLENMANNCSNMLRHLPLKSAPSGMQNRAKYSCGMLIQWITDLNLRHLTGNENIWGVWRTVWPTGKVSISIDPVSLYTMTVLKSAPAASSLTGKILVSDGTERWLEIIDTLNEFGAVAELKKPSPFSMRIAATQAIVLSSCGVFWGAGENGEGNLYVSAPETCELFGQGQIILRVDGIDPMRNPEQFLELVTEKCINKKNITLTLLENQKRLTEALLCTIPVLPPPAQINVKRAFALN